jgi:hypothetical protein
MNGFLGLMPEIKSFTCVRNKLGHEVGDMTPSNRVLLSLLVGSESERFTVEMKGASMPSIVPTYRSMECA